MSSGDPTHEFTMDSLFPDAATVECTVELPVAAVVDEDASLVAVLNFSVVEEVSLDAVVDEDVEEDEHDASSDARTRTANERRREVVFRDALSIDAFGGRAICS